jgi:hypothetical protein
MSDVVNDAPHEFWRPPMVQQVAGVPAMVEVCDGCGTEFMVGAGFCHACGASRQQATSTTERSWLRVWEALEFLEFQNVKRRLGLPMASLIAFLVGVGCLLAVVAAGLVYSVQNLADFQALQSYRMQWLLAAVAAFVAGILLKNPEAKD